ncbi:MAG: lipopolysaccharide heptosyltransferase I, partial [Microbacteriaceae bacterium]|nr:lipopolysaccharide heptosyltransferase I [Burkholderiaceae bacterium]
PTRWVADVALRIAPHVHAVQRSRQLCAMALGYAMPAHLHYGLRARAGHAIGVEPEVVLVHGSSRDDKGWPDSHWGELGARLIALGLPLGLPHGSDAGRERSVRLARALGQRAQAWPRLDLGALADRFAASVGVIGVDSGLSHIAVALDRPHVQIYNFETSWRTGPLPSAGTAHPRQVSVYGQPTPTVDQVWRGWLQVSAR